MNKLLKNLEYDKVLDIIAAYTVSQTAKSGIYHLIQPQKTLAEAIALLDQTEEAYKLYYGLSLRPLTSFDDAESVIVKSKVSAILTLSDLRRIFSLLRAGRIAKHTIEDASISTNLGIVLLKDITGTYQGDNKLEKDIGDSVLSDTEISDNASTRLKEIRKKLVAAKVALNEKLKQYSRRSEVSLYLQDDLVTIREGRYVLPVKAECRSMVQGLVHDRSSTGATVFVEPFAVVEMNNGIRTLQFEEQQEIERILAQLTEGVSAIADDLSVMQSALLQLDVIFAKMHFAADYRCTRPELNDKGHIKLINSRHPLIERDKVVPVTLELGDKYRILTVTGPNTGGKTVALKTAGLFCLLAASGIFLPAAEGSIASVFTNVFSDIGDEQSITSSLSTFSSHIVNIINIVNNADNHSLVLLDELGGGTDPEEGAALAIGILKFLELTGCCAIITTHYGQLKEYALTSSKIQNASMQFDNVTLRPTYRLIMGLPGSSNALKIAQTLGINDYIIKEAYNSLSKEKIRLEEILSSAEKARTEAYKLLEAAELEKKQVTALKTELAGEKEKISEHLFKIKQNAKAEVRRIAANSSETAAALIEEIKEKLAKADEKALLEAKRLYKKIEDIRYDAGSGDDLKDAHSAEQLRPLKTDELIAGTDVYIISLGVTGKIISVNHEKKEAAVQAGVAVANIKFDNLSKPIIKTKASVNNYGKPSNAIKAKKSTGGETTVQEINVIGLTVEEALVIVECKIEQMADFCGSASDDEDSRAILRIIHGKGTGALGRGIQSHLKALKCIASYRYGRYGEGETGVTVVEFK